jgi:hypothetical protein
MTEFLVLMWLADIAGSISFVGGLSLIAFFIGIAGAKMMGMMSYPERDIPAWKHCRWLLIPAAIALVSPSQKTIYAFIVAEAGKSAIDSQIGQKAMQTIDSILDEVAKKAKG